MATEPWQNRYRLELEQEESKTWKWLEEDRRTEVEKKAAKLAAKREAAEAVREMAAKLGLSEAEIREFLQQTTPAPE